MNIECSDAANLSMSKVNMFDEFMLLTFRISTSYKEKIKLFHD